MSTKKIKTVKTKNENEMPAICRSAMLVSLRISMWEGKCKDPSVTKEVQSSNGAKEGTGSWNTRIIPASALTAVVRAADAGRAIHWKYSMPWANVGQRIMPAKAFFEFNKEIRDARETFQKEVDAFTKKYPEYVAAAPERLNGLLRSNVFPAADRISALFDWDVEVTPVPIAGDFRVDIASEDAKEIREAIERQANDSLETAMKDLYRRLHETVSKVADTLSDPDKTYRDTIFDKLKDLTNILPSLNVTDSNELTKLRDEVVEKLTKQEPATLRTNKALRADVAKSASSILDKMKAFLPQE